MKLITTLLAVSLVACLKPVPPKAEVIDLQPGETYMRPVIIPGCNMDQVMDTVTEQCCPKACTPKGYDHHIHVECSVAIIVAAKCTMHNLDMNTATSVCACDAPSEECPNETP